VIRTSSLDRLKRSLAVAFGLCSVSKSDFRILLVSQVPNEVVDAESSACAQIRCLSQLKAAAIELQLGKLESASMASRLIIADAFTCNMEHCQLLVSQSTNPMTRREHAVDHQI
jgi:hypothetical protein